MDKTTVYIIEYREKINEFGMVVDLAFITSTEEKALDTIKEHKDYETDEKKIWWWCIYPIDVDGSFKDINKNLENIKFYDKSGKQLKDQP